MSDCSDDGCGSGAPGKAIKRTVGRTTVWARVRGPNIVLRVERSGEPYEPEATFAIRPGFHRDRIAQLAEIAACAFEALDEWPTREQIEDGLAAGRFGTLEIDGGGP